MYYNTGNKQPDYANKMLNGQIQQGRKKPGQQGGAAAPHLCISRC